jgi:hypothetical protein
MGCATLGLDTLWIGLDLPGSPVLEAAIAGMQKKADDLAPPESAPPMMIERRGAGDGPGGGGEAERAAAVMPQIRRVVVELRHPEPPRPTTGHVETPAERAKRVVRIIRSRCSSVLSQDDLALVLKTRPKRRS